MNENTLSPAPPPKTELERYRILATTAGAKVSPLVLGGMSFGKSYDNAMGSMDKEQTFALIDAFYEAGGNFIDTASNYQDEDSEKYIGEWMRVRDRRDQMFIATKASTNYRNYEIGKGYHAANYSGNSRKTFHMSIRDSLVKLQTDYIDHLFVHFWDYSTGIEEVMDTLHTFVEQGKVLYLGVSNTPAWVVSAANTYAARAGKTPFSVYQGRWNVLRRDFERDVIPMARHFGMALTPWDVLGSGKFQSRAQIEARRAQGEPLRVTFNSSMTLSRDLDESELRASQAMEKVAGEIGPDVTVQQIALAYVRHKTENVFPIIGGRKIQHLRDNIKALSVRLTDAQIKFLESVSPFDIGFPQTVIGDDPRTYDAPSFLTTLSSHVDFPRNGKPLRDH